MKRSVTPEIVMQNFAQYGHEIDIEMAEKILDLMYDLSELSVKTEMNWRQGMKNFREAP